MAEARSFAFMRIFRIPDNSDGSLYLWRLRVLETPWFGVMLHRIFKPDGDRHLHDHPFSFVSIVLRGRYTEQVKPVGATHPDWQTVRWCNVKSADTAHRIHSVSRSPVWTLVLRGPRHGSWGFHVGFGARNRGKGSVGWVHWKEYLGIESKSTDKQSIASAGKAPC